MNKTELQHPLEANYIQDQALAWDMAHAEKPHSEDAIAINALIERTHEYDEALDHTRPLDTGRNGGSSTSLVTTSPKTANMNARLGLEAAKHASINLAADAAEQARKQYLAENPQASAPEHTDTPNS